MPDFFAQPVLNSPYDYPTSHWEIDDDGQPTNRIIPGRRAANYVTPVPLPRRRSGAEEQRPLVMDEGQGLSDERQQYDPMPIIASLRQRVDEWRKIQDHRQWRVTPETARLLQHWRNHRFSGVRPFFCQVEALETLIWLTEVAPSSGRQSEVIRQHLQGANAQANPGLGRLALKLATGAGKTTIMAMLIAWQTVNAVRRPSSINFTRGFLVVTPGITIRDRLRVLQPNDPDSYYKSRELAPPDMLPDLHKARIVITNYHAFKRRETLSLSKGGRDLLRGRSGPDVRTQETEGQMLQRVMPDLLNMRSILAINDEAHHCYRQRPADQDAEGKLSGDDLSEAKHNREAARLWISGLEAVHRKLGLRRVIDLSATPFFLRGSGYAEGTLFPWTMSDFSLLDAIECGIVKLPRVPVADNVPGPDMPMLRDLWKHIRSDMPKSGRARAGRLDPQRLPTLLKSALDALYGHYEQTFQLWREAGIETPPCFIIVCNNTSTSKLIHDYVAGYVSSQPNGAAANDPAPDAPASVVPGRLELFRNFDANGARLPRPRTLLIDSRQLESGDALDRNFRRLAADEIERFRRDIVERTGDRAQAERISDQDLLREVMNTVGKPGRLGESIRCVVSVAMLTEGWDANTVTHVLGVRAFGAQLLCEQAVGRALRRQSYETNQDGLLEVEYADVLGIPFDFTAKPVVVDPPPPRRTVHVHAVVPDRDACEIRFPRVYGYRVDLPGERLGAKFTRDSTLELTPGLVGPTITRNQGFIGEGVDLTVDHLDDVRRATLEYHLTSHLLHEKWRDASGAPMLHLFGQLRQIVRQWLDQHLRCAGGARPAQLLYRELADRACQRITDAVVRRSASRQNVVRAVLDAYNPAGSTRFVNFRTSKSSRWQTDPRRCHVNWAVCDSEWETEFCRVLESNPRVAAYVKNQALGFEVPYTSAGAARRYLPDFILRVDDGRVDAQGDPDLLNLVVEIKGYRGEDAKEKAAAMADYWIPAVNHLRSFGRWTFAELTNPHTLPEDLTAALTP